MGEATISNYVITGNFLFAKNEQKNTDQIATVDNFFFKDYCNDSHDAW